MSCEINEEPWEIAMRKNAEQAMREAAAWAAKWPNHCRCCRGWGGFPFEERHGLKHGVGEPLIDPCPYGPEEMCHRCGANGMDHHDSPCRDCGWHYDDGMPE